MDEQIRIILIILVAVSLFGLIVFILVKNYIKASRIFSKPKKIKKIILFYFLFRMANELFVSRYITSICSFSLKNISLTLDLIGINKSLMISLFLYSKKYKLIIPSFNFAVPIVPTKKISLSNYKKFCLLQQFDLYLQRVQNILMVLFKYNLYVIFNGESLYLTSLSSSLSK